MHCFKMRIRFWWEFNNRKDIVDNYLSLFVTEAAQFCVTAGSTLIQISAIKGVRPIHFFLLLTFFKNINFLNHFILQTQVVKSNDRFNGRGHRDC